MILDIVLIVIIIISTILGYKKGLVKLASGLFAGIIAIILTFALYKPVSNLLIEKTDIAKNIENEIIENSKKGIEDNSAINNNIFYKGITEEVLPYQAKNISIRLTYMLSGIIIYVIVKIILSILIALISSIASLPILKQFNEAGGIVYGLIRGIIISCIVIFIIGIISSVNPTSAISKMAQNSYVSELIYNNLIIK